MKQLAIIILVIGVICACLNWVFYPNIPSSILGWFVLVFVGFPALVFIEWLVGAILQFRFFQRRSSVVRIIIGIPIVCFLVVGILLIIGYIHELISFVDG